MTALAIDTAAVFEPLLAPARYKGAHGGRGSGKSHFFAGLAVEDAIAFPGESGEGLRMVCIREVQKSLKHSAKSLIEAKLAEFGLREADGFKVFNEVIKTPGDGVIIFQGMQDHTADSIKSLEGFHRAWVEEAQSLSSTSLGLLRPTIRWEDAARGLASEMWFGWNPRRKTDPVDVLLRGENLPTGAAVVRANWSDNPWFPSVLEQERLDCLRDSPDQYDHIWEGGYATAAAGAYFAQALVTAKAEGRIGRVAADPLMTTRGYWDIGGTGAKADACAIWIVQFVGREVRVLDYYEAQGQPLATHVAWLRSRGYERAQCVLPHDGAANDKVHQVSYQSALQQAGFDVRVIPNMGAGAASKRIEAVRRLFPSIYFHETTTEPGRDALGFYHERKDDKRGIGLGPEHDWSSHAADAFGLMAVDHEQNGPDRKPVRLNFTSEFR
ncbi:PBSX family phage terminase large subunit [Pseudoxanthomonas jiangsuensis]|uniref:phage terminase large subunit n=1 Tax=Pseudoxanthomonas jiangsuensis TaxID=619688 RepID=UPI00139154BD|nr:phage terminase large subunit [Pseudoxanthomonas jiangsuensis]KAF1698352.1 PBSX family phage terminase large subunit [Pseudoxanthomonas jiangsuensis]